MHAHRLVYVLAAPQPHGGGSGVPRAGPGAVATKSVAFEAVPWHHVRVGDVVMVQRDEQMPADLVFLCAEVGCGAGRWGAHTCACM
jgi:hypothetical protein